jgi:protein-S-isoprenylcysteine O-methyltransferase Ste14
MVKFFVTWPLWWSAVFASAGRIDWDRGWIWATVFAVGMVAASLLVRRKNPALMEAWSHLRRKDTKPFDKVFLSVYIPLVFLQPILAGLDAVRFGWSSLPFATVYVGLVVLAIAITPITWALMVNPYAESSVRIQTDRDHKVVTSGPYRIVRHPMYIGAILMYPAIALMLGSMWALALSGLIAILIVWRTALEDRTLRRELPGYEEFATLTRYRLIPGLW